MPLYAALVERILSASRALRALRSALQAVVAKPLNT
jgi:hypothetical protein